MSDYIKREDVLNKIYEIFCDEYYFPTCEKAMVGAKEETDELPSADVVEVVRCKYCKYSRVADMDDQEDGYLCSLLHGHEFFSYDYCSYGERKDEEDENI